MKANSSGNRYSGTALSYERSMEERDDREEDLASPGARAGEPRAYERELFVYHQQDLARRALHLGSPGAARAALRALYGVDFVDSRGAIEHLRVLRDPASPQDEVMHALRALIQLRPEGPNRPRVRTEEITPLDRHGNPYSDD